MLASKAREKWQIDPILPIYGGEDPRCWLLLEEIKQHIPPPPKTRRRRTRLVTGKSLDSPEKGNVDKKSEKCRQNVRKMSKNCPEELKTQLKDIFWQYFAYLVDAFVSWPCPMLARYRSRRMMECSDSLRNGLAVKNALLGVLEMALRSHGALQSYFPPMQLARGRSETAPESRAKMKCHPDINCCNTNPKLVTGKSLDSPEKGNVDKMSEECRKNVLTVFEHLVHAFVWWPCPRLARYNPKPIG